MSAFDDLFDKSPLPIVFKQAKTISKEECRAVYDYMNECRPKTILEFGTQYGCSTCMFICLAKWLKTDIKLHSWDILDQVKGICINKNHFMLHIEDITGKEEEVFQRYKPDMLFLDAHPYILTRNLVKICLRDKIDFMCHDVSLAIINALKARSNNFKDTTIYGAWEPYVLSELIDKKILTDDYYENDQVVVKCIRDKYGLAIVRNKK